MTSLVILMSNIYQIFKVEIIPILYKLRNEKRKREHFPTYVIDQTKGIIRSL